MYYLSSETSVQKGCSPLFQNNVYIANDGLKKIFIRALVIFPITFDCIYKINNELMELLLICIIELKVR